jgi:hypothetical protein
LENGNNKNIDWKGEIWAGFIRSKNWSSRLEASREKIYLTGPMNMRYSLKSSQVNEIIPAIGKFLFWSWQIRGAIRIIHNHKKIPSKFVFQAKGIQTAEMLSKLENLGYKLG